MSLCKYQNNHIVDPYMLRINTMFCKPYTNMYIIFSKRVSVFQKKLPLPSCCIVPLV